MAECPGLTKFHIYDMTIGEVLSLRRAVQMRNSRQWEMHRFTSYMVAAANPNRKGRLPKIHNFLPLLSDRERYEDEVNEREERHDIFRSLHQQYTERWKN